MQGLADAVKIRAFDDIDAIREATLSSTVDALSRLEPFKYGGYSLRLSDVKPGKTPDISYENHKKALLARGTLGTPIWGTWTLSDKMGAPVDSKRRLLMTLPALTKHGTYVRGGIEYTVANQVRLKPGVYTHRKGNDELESHFNVLPGTGAQFRIKYDPDTNKFQLNARQSNVPLLPILRGLGVPDSEIQRYWGEETLKDNDTKLRGDDLERAAKNLAPTYEKDDDRPAEERLKDAFLAAGLDPEVTEKTLGKKFDHVEPEAILRATSKLLRVHRGEEDPDDRDSLSFQKVMSHEDLFAERVAKDSPRLVQKALFNAIRKKSIDGIPPGVLNKHVDGIILDSGLGQSLEETNLTEVLDQLVRVSRLGRGAIGDINAIPDEARAVQSSYAGFIDPIRSPESGKIGVDNRFSHGVMKGSDGRLYRQVLDPKTGGEKMVSAEELSDLTLAFPGELERDDPKVAAISRGRFKRVPREDVDYVIPSPVDMFTTQVNLMPALSQVSGGRVFLGSKFVSQAMPLKHRESPLVQSAHPTMKSFEQEVGNRIGTVMSDVKGSVTSVSDTKIRVRDDKTGKIQNYDLANYLPHNRRSYIKHIPSVKIGDKILPGDILATSNITDDKGDLALGTNLRVAYVPFSRGEASNYEDAVVVSESGAAKLAAEEMFMHKQSHLAGEMSKHRFRALFPGIYNANQLKTIDDEGLAKPGTVVQKGDPLILSVQSKGPVKPGMGDKGSKLRYRDTSVVWKHDTPGYVTDRAMGSAGAVVAVAAMNPLHVGDKLCYDPETEVLTSRGWAKINEVLPTDKIASLNSEGRLEYVGIAAIQQFQHKGEMYRLATTQVDLCVTPNHNLYASRSRTAAEFSLQRADSLFGKRYKLKNNAEWVGVSDEYVTIPGLEIPCGHHGHGTRELPPIQLTTKAYMSLLGAYISEGSVVNYHRTDKHRGYTREVHIRQTKSKGVAEAKKHLIPLLEENGLSCRYAQQRFHIGCAQLSVYFSQFGRSHEKRLPAWVFDCAKSDLLELYRWLMWGAGHVGRTTNVYTTTSEGLAGDFQRLCLHLGWAANIKTRPATRGTIKGKEYDFRKRYDVYVYKHKNNPQINHGHAKTQNGQSEEWVDYDGPVHCVTLVKNHVLYVRRNGKPVWCGNSGRFGDKGVVSSILPDAKMPRDANGNAFDILVNPLGVISRGNPAQLVEAALGKIARQTGQSVAVPSFAPYDYVKTAIEDLKKAGMSPSETIYDPELNQDIPDVATGERFFYRLHHLAEKKLSGRGAGTGGYTAEGMPAKGGDESSPRIGLMEINALASGNAFKVLEDAHKFRGSRNADYWRAVMLGYAPPAPQQSDTLSKFLAGLSAAGVHVDQKGSKLNILAMRDADVDEMAIGEVTKADTVTMPDMKPVDGGLFDRGITGGHGGTKFSKVEFGTKIPNPIMEDPIRRLLRLTKDQFRGVLAGKEQLDGKTGPDAIASALSKINLDTSISHEMQTVKTAKKTPRDQAIKRLRILKMMKDNQYKPEDMLISKMAVLPPAYRPISMLEGMPLVNQTNYLYKDLLQAKNNRATLEKQLGPANVGEETLALYDAAAAVIGVGDPIGKETQERGVKGILKTIFGDSPKSGYYQRKLMGTTVDLGGRAVITPDPRLNMDQVGLPENAAWRSYNPFVMRRLVRSGFTPVQAAEAIKNRTPQAVAMLQAEMKYRPVFINRAPSLHRYSLMGAWPVLSKSDTIRISPPVVSAYGADFDGDQQINKVLIIVSEKDYDADLRSISEEITHMSYFRTIVGRLNQDEHLLLVDLQDFPHCGEGTTKDHITFYGVPEGVRVIAIDEQAGQLVQAKVAGWSVHRDRLVEIVTLSSGKQIITDDDPRAVYGLDGDTLQWCRRRPSEADRQFVPIATKDESIGVSRQVVSLPTDSSSRLRKSVVLSEAFGCLVGLLAGDGWATCSDGEPRAVSLATSYPEIRKAFEKYLLTCFLDAPTVSEANPQDGKFENSKGCKRYTVTCKAFARVMQQWIGRGAKNKHLPPFVFTAPKEFKLGVLAGLFASDGSIAISNAKSKSQWLLSVTSSSIRLIQEIQWLLRTLGVNSTITPTKTPKDKAFWMLGISTPDFHKLQRLAVANTEKAKRFEQFFSQESPDASKAGSRFRLMPLPDCLRIELRNLVNRMESSESKKLYNVLGTPRGHISHLAAKRLLEYLRSHSLSCSHPLFNDWSRLVDQNAFHFERVAAVEKTNIAETGYDLTVPGFETFMSVDGVILSNTMAFHVPASEEARKQIIEKMMPSKQLLSTANFKAQFKPRQEFQLGLWEATRPKKHRSVKVFESEKDAIAAFRRGEVRLDDIIEIPGKTTRTNMLLELTQGLA